MNSLKHIETVSSKKNNISANKRVVSSYELTTLLFVQNYYASALAFFLAALASAALPLGLTRMKQTSKAIT